MASVVNLETARTLVETGSVGDVTVQGREGGFALLLAAGGHVLTLVTKAGHVRLFRNLEAAAKVLRGLGVVRYAVDEAQFVAPQPVQRPDTAARMAEQLSAAEHDRWFRQQVAEAIIEADDPNTKWLTLDEVMADLRARAMRDTQAMENHR